ncbi:hypothetical protein [Acidihalobacter yilgarnensis]|nr:hypothetical protein [Acidihalobacter yilgarnensis]
MAILLMPSGRWSFTPSPNDERGNTAAHPRAAQTRIWPSEAPLYRPLGLDPFTHQAFLNGWSIALRAKKIERLQALHGRGTRAVSHERLETLMWAGKPNARTHLSDPQPARVTEVPEAADHDPQRQGSWRAAGARRTATHVAPQRAQKGEDHIVHTGEAPASHCDHAALDSTDQMTLRSIPRVSLHTSRRHLADASPMTRISSASERWDDVSKIIHRVAMPPACLLHIKG